MTPPPDCSKSGPYEALLHSVTSQPLLLFKVASQFVRFLEFSDFLRVSDYIKWLQSNYTHINGSRHGDIRVYRASWYPIRNKIEGKRWGQPTRSRMPCNLVMFVIMDTFQNIYFSVLRWRYWRKEKKFKDLCSHHRPIGSYSPKSRPDSCNNGRVKMGVPIKRE